jgi:hypothetical protein
VSTTRGGSRVAGGNDSRLRRLMPPWENRGKRATGERQIAPRGASRCVRRPAPAGDLDSDRKRASPGRVTTVGGLSTSKKEAPTALAQSPQGACPALRNRAIPAEIRPAARTAKPPEQAQRVSDAWEVSLRGVGSPEHRKARAMVADPTTPRAGPAATPAAIRTGARPHRRTSASVRLSSKLASPRITMPRQATGAI